MATIFDALFTEAGKKTKLYPSVAADAIRATLVAIEPYHEWVETGEVGEDGKPKRKQSDALVIDESGERLRCVLSLVLTDESGLSTSASAPFRDQSHYFDMDTVKALMSSVGKPIKLTNARIEFRESGKRDSRWGGIETRLAFAFDGVEV